MIDKAKILGVLRRFSGDNPNQYLSTEHRQNLKTLEYWYNDLFSFLKVVRKDSVNFPCYIEITDASGTAALNVSRSPDVIKITRQSAGRYTIFFKQAFTGVNYLTSYIELSSGSPASSILILRSFDTTLRTVTVEFLNGSYTATDVASGSKIGIKIYIDEE